MEEENTPTKTFVRAALPANTCLQCRSSVADPNKRRRLFSGTKKTKTALNLELLLGRVFDITEKGTICRSCSERNETLTKKIFMVRQEFSETREKLDAEGSKCVKRLAEPSSEDNLMEPTTSGSSQKRRALFAASGMNGTILGTEPLLEKRDGCTQTEPKHLNVEETTGCKSK